MSLDDRLRRHFDFEAARLALTPAPPSGALEARSRWRRRRRATAVGIGVVAGALASIGLAMVSPDGSPDRRTLAVPPPEAAPVVPPSAIVPSAPALTVATVAPGAASVDEYELAEASTFPDLVRVTADDDGFVLADPAGSSGWSFLRSADGRQWSGVSSDLPADLVAAPAAAVGDQTAVFGGLRRGLSSPWARRDVVAAVSDDLGHWEIIELPVPLSSPRQVEDVVVFEGFAGDFLALGSLTVDFEALVWERLPVAVQADLLDALEGGASFSQWVLVVDEDRVAIELHRFATGVERVLFESTIDELGLSAFVGPDGVRADRRYVAWTLDADGLPSSAETRGLTLSTITGTGRMGDSAWALGTEADGTAALYRSRDGVRWAPVETLDLSGIDEPVHLLVEPFRLTVYGVHDDQVIDWRSDDGEAWRQRVVWVHDAPIESVAAIRGAGGGPVVTIGVAGQGEEATMVLSTEDGGANWRLVRLDRDVELLASWGDTLLVRRPAGADDAPSNPYRISRVQVAS